MIFAESMLRGLIEKDYIRNTRVKPGPISLDIHLGDTLFRSKGGLSRDLLSKGFLTQDEVQQQMVEFEIPKGGYVIGPTDMLRYIPQEQFVNRLPAEVSSIISSGSEQFPSFTHIGAEVTSKSRIARRHTQSQLSMPIGDKTSYTNMVLLNNFSTSTRVFPGESLAQLHYTGPEMTPHGVMDIRIDDDILIYDGVAILDEGTAKSNNGFHSESLKNGSLFIPKNTFFLASSRDTFCMPDGYAGYLDCTSVRWQEDMNNADNLRFSVHPNAPYIGPNSAFEGKIVLEVRALMDCYLNSNDRLGSLTYRSLIGDAGVSKSRFHGQNGPVRF